MNYRWCFRLALGATVISFWWCVSLLSEQRYEGGLARREVYFLREDNEMLLNHNRILSDMAERCGKIQSPFTGSGVGYENKSKVVGR